MEGPKLICSFQHCSNPIWCFIRSKNFRHSKSVKESFHQNNSNHFSSAIRQSYRKSTLSIVIPDQYNISITRSSFLQETNTIHRTLREWMQSWNWLNHSTSFFIGIEYLLHVSLPATIDLVMSITCGASWSVFNCIAVVDHVDIRNTIPSHPSIFSTVLD